MKNTDFVDNLDFLVIDINFYYIPKTGLKRHIIL